MVVGLLHSVAMAPEKKPEIEEKDLQGFKYFKRMIPLLERLRSVGTEMERAGNRKLCFDHYTGLVLLYFFSPILTSLRGIQQASSLKKVQKLLGCSRLSMGSLSEAVHVFDPSVLQEIIRELAMEVRPVVPPGEWKALKGLTAVDGSLLPALPKMAWALWVDEQHRAAKMHLQFEVFKAIPVKISVTEGNGSEIEQLRCMLEPGRLYVVDRGYREYGLFQAIIDAGSSFIGRIQDNSVLTVLEERPLSEEAKAAGVVRDLVVRLGGPQSGAVFKQPLRVIEVRAKKPGKSDEIVELLLATDRMDLAAELVAIGYRFRWSIELFFRWFKCILGCQHLLSQSKNGVTIQAYVAVIASLLVSLWTGCKPNKRTFEMLCFHFSGMADDEELEAHIEKLQKQKA